MRKLKMIAAVVFMAVTGSFAQVVSNTNAAGPGSLQEAVAFAKANPGPQTITFNIPGAGPHIIQPGTLQLNSFTPASILIDGTSQHDYAGVPLIIIRGPGSGNGFEVSMSNLTIRGLIIQNYAVGYYQTGGNLNQITSCWFGLNQAGNAAGGFNNKQYGIYLNGNSGSNSISIGSQSDFTAVTRNVISGSGIAGVKFENAGSGSYVGNTFIGTNFSGTAGIPNGTDVTAGTENRHGISIIRTSSVTVKNNLISTNRSGGIDIFRGSNNSLVGNNIITGNKIGTDVTGMLPLGNRTFGIRIREAGGNTIGGANPDDRNIISANGSADFPHVPRTIQPNEFDWYNSCGIYLFNSSNNIVANNYIGVDATGNRITLNSSYDLGNFYVGLKIDGDGTSANNIIGLNNAGNVFGGNGFRSSIEAASRGYINLDGHGLIIKDRLTTATLIVANRIGIGADGFSKIGNKQDGISIQGATGTTIGGTLAGQRNIIGDNVWGIYIATNYYNSQTTNTRILNNYIGVDVTGTLPVGNGVRPDNTSGGGIGITHFTQGTTIGGTTAQEGNIISGNRTGISLLGRSPADIPLLSADAGKGSSGTKIFRNLIGLGSDRTTIIKNNDHGIYIGEKANLNDIGDTGQGNIIAGNGLNGIYSQDAFNNTFTGNTIYGNGGNGVQFTAASNGNRLFGNTIGDLTIAARGNKGDGININASANNILGGTAAGQGNFIGNNTGNGIAMIGTVSNNNSIHLNQFSCNGLRGIELNGVANANFAKPIISGADTALVVTGPAGSYIELYSLDGCNNCTDLTSKKLQGRTLRASGISPLRYKGTEGETYTATASEAYATAAHKTSEFSDCYGLCPTSNLALSVNSSSPFCLGNTASLNIVNAEPGRRYQVFNGTTSVSSVYVGTGGTLNIPLTLTLPGTYTLRISVNTTGCSARDLTVRPVIIINDKADVTLDVTTNSPVCVGNQAIVTIIKSQLNRTYQVYNGMASVSSIVTGTGNDLPVTLNTLTAGTYTVSIQVGGGGCAPVRLNKQPVIVVNSPPRTDSDVSVTTPVCFQAEAYLTVARSESGKSYQVFDNNNVAVSLPVTSSLDGPLQIRLNSLPIGTHVLTVRASVPGCNGTFVFANKATLVVNKGLSNELLLKYLPDICLGTPATITIEKSEAGVEYQAFNQKDRSPASDVISGNGTDRIITLYPLPAGTNVIYFNAKIGGCGTVTLGNVATIKVNTDIIKNLKATATSPICFRDIAVVSIENSETDKTYEIFENKVSVSARIPGNNGTIQINVPNLAAGDHKFTVNVTVPGCKNDTLLQNPFTVVNSVPDSTLKVGTNGPVCAGNTAVFYILKPQPGKKYQIFNNGASVSAIVTGTGQDTLKITLNNLPPGVYNLTARATADGCKSVTDLTDKASITINSIPVKTLNATVNGPVCLGKPAIVTVEKAETGKSYQVYFNGAVVSPSLPGSGQDLAIPVNTQSMPAGDHTLAIEIKVPGCVADTLIKKPVLTVNPLPDSTLFVSAVTSPICVGTDGAVSIAGIQPKVIYQAFVGTDTASISLSGPGPNLVLPVLSEKLKVGLNTVYIKATITGCAEISLKNTASITVNPNPKLDLGISVAPDVICKGGASVLTISTSENGVRYQAVTSGKIVSESVLGNGEEVKLNLTGLPVGKDTVAVVASIGGCSDKNLDKTVVITVNEDGKLDYSVSGSVICKGQNGSAVIKGTETGVSYEAIIGSTKLPALNGNDGDLLFNIPAELLTEGNNLVTFTAITQGCGPLTLDSTANVIVNDITTSKELLTKGSDICVYDTEGSATILAAKRGVTYGAAIGSTILIPQAGNDADLIFTVPVASVQMGANIVSFSASIEGCGTISLSNNAIINRNDNTTSKDLATKGSTACMNDQFATATIISAKAGINYQAFLGDKPVSSISSGKDEDLSLSVQVSDLESGSNAVSFLATVSGCSPVKLNNDAIVIVLGERYNISGSTLRCFNTEGTYSITPVSGIMSYNWLVPEEAVITEGQGTSSIKVTFGTKSGVVSVIPAGTISTCDGLSSELPIRVEPPYTDTLSIIGKDTVCINEKDRIFVDSSRIYGVDEIIWTWSSGIELLDTLNKKSVFRNFGVNYPVIGKQMITATPHLTCSDTYGVADTLIVTVLGYPVAEAGTYPLIENDLNSSVRLNGTGSSLEGDTPYDSLAYKWTTSDRFVSIFNSSMLNSAYFVPAEAETKVYLTVTNHNRCPARDSAIVNVSINIDIPNVFTPNGDGTHDTWEIKNLNKLYPNCTVEVFNKWGSFIYRSQGYAEAWDGNRNGEELPVATYYYVVDFKNGNKPKVGSVTIIR